MPLQKFLETIIEPESRIEFIERHGAVDITVDCRHGLDFDKTQIKPDELFPDILAEIVMTIGTSIRHAAVAGERMPGGEVPLANFYWNSATPLPLPPSTVSKYVTTAILGMFLSRPEAYSLVLRRKNSLYKEMLLSAISSVIYNVDDAEEEWGGES